MNLYAMDSNLELPSRPCKWIVDHPCLLFLSPGNRPPCPLNRVGVKYQQQKIEMKRNFLASRSMIKNFIIIRKSSRQSSKYWQQFQLFKPIYVNPTLGAPQCMTQRTSGLSMPIPKAMVATTTWTSSYRNALCASWQKGIEF